MSNADRDQNHYVDVDHPYLKDYFAGFTHTQIAIKHNTSNKAVEAVLRRRRKVDLSITEDELREKFKEGKTLKEVAKELNTNVWALNRHTKYNGFNGNVWLECRAEALSGKKLTPELARDLYITKKWSSIKIAKEFGFVGDIAIRERLEKWGIRVRRDGEHQLPLTVIAPPEPPKPETRAFFPAVEIFALAIKSTLTVMVPPFPPIPPVAPAAADPSVVEFPPVI